MSWFVFDAETVYGPGPKPVSVYCPFTPVSTGPTGGVPDVLEHETFLTNRGGAGLPIALPYVIVPLIDGVFAGVGVAVDVLVGVCVPPSGGVAVDVAVAVAVAVAVLDGVGVGDTQVGTSWVRISPPGNTDV